MEGRSYVGPLVEGYLVHRLVLSRSLTMSADFSRGYQSAGPMLMPSRNTDINGALGGLR